MPKETNYEDCKGPYRHAWFDHDGSGFRKPPFGVAFHIQCFRCGTIRRDIIAPHSGDLLQRRYYYPEGYKDSRDEKPSTEQLRMAAIKTQRRNVKATKNMPKLTTEK